MIKFRKLNTEKEYNISPIFPIKNCLFFLVNYSISPIFRMKNEVPIKK